VDKEITGGLLALGAAAVGALLTQLGPAAKWLCACLRKRRGIRCNILAFRCGKFSAPMALVRLQNLDDEPVVLQALTMAFGVQQASRRRPHVLVKGSPGGSKPFRNPGDAQDAFTRGRSALGMKSDQGTVYPDWAVGVHLAGHGERFIVVRAMCSQTAAANALQRLSPAPNARAGLTPLLGVKLKCFERTRRFCGSPLAAWAWIDTPRPPFFDKAKEPPQ